ncbi:MAG: hypothetical protein F4Y68_01830 [Boseongicola sp. SB0665_bin_10]|nr:hypothetical protein [Boseongicola sp. SB0665_bin_10]
MTHGTKMTRNAGRAAIYTRRRLRVTTALALVAFSAMPLATLPSPAPAQAAQGGTLGIDCDKPRYNAEGKLILDFTDGARQAICEAYRTTALTYANNVIETANRLRLALQTLPPPVWEDLVEHLRTDDDVADWTFTDAVAMGRLQALSTAAPQAVSRDGQTTSSGAHGVATHWRNGMLAASGIGADWHPHIRARACGFDANDMPVRGAVVLVWLDPGIVRDSWTSRMVQRTALAWHERRSDRSAATSKVPHVLTAANRITDARGRTREVTGNAAIWTCLDTVPVGALVERVTLRQPRRGGERALRCEDPTEIGSRKLVWERRGGVYVVPAFAVLADGSDHPDRGEPLLGQSPDLPLVTEEPDPASATPQPGEFLRLGSSCRPPRWLDAVRPQDCPAEINGVAVTGTHVRRFRFRETQSDPVDPFRVDWEPVMPDPLDPGSELGIVVPSGVQHPEWASVTVFCDSIPPSDAPPVPPRVNDWTPDSCPTQWGGRFDQGERLGYTQHFDYPASWNTSGVKRDEAIRTVDDDCFNPVAQSGTQKRPRRNCPAGQVGATIEARSFSWWNREWAVPVRHAGGTEGNRSLGQAAAAYDANPSQSGLDTWDIVTLVQDWHVVANTCRTPSSGGNGNGGSNGNSGGSYDVDGDGVGDFDNEADANAYNEHFGTPGSTVQEVDNCGDCEGHGGSERPPSRPTPPSDDDDDDSGSGGGGWG